MPAADIEDADPAQLVRMLEDALGWLKEEWFNPWLSDEAHRDLALDLDVDDRQQVQRLGTPYLEERLDEVTHLVREMAGELLDAPPTEAKDAAAWWAAAYRRPLAYVVDLYELAARRNAQVRAIVEGAGWEVEQPGLLLSETAEDAMTILYEGLQRLAGILEEAARARGANLPPGGALLDREFRDARSDDGRFNEAHRRAWGSAGRGGRR